MMKLARAHAIPLFFVLACCLTGCSRRWVSKTPPAVAAAAYGSADFEKDQAAYETAEDATARLRLRNRMIYQFIAEIERAYDDVEQAISAQRAGWMVARDFIQLGLGAGTTLGGGERAKTVLATLLTGVTGLDLSIDKNLFRRQTTQAILSAMRAGRNIVKARIVSRLAQDDDTYPWAAARSDLQELLAAGSFRQGIQRLQQTAAAEAQATQVDLNIVLVAAAPPDDRANATRLNQSIAAAFKAKEFSRIVTYLQALGSAVDGSTAPEKLEQEIRSFRKKAETDAQFRATLFDEARKAQLIP